MVIFKNGQGSFFPGNFIFAQIWAKRAQNMFFGIFWKILSLVFFGNNLKWKLLLLLIFRHQVSSYGPKYCQPIKLQDSLKCNISRKKWMIKCTFGMKINIKVFFKLILSFLVCATRHTQSTQNKFAVLSNISRKAWEMKLIFCLQINASFLQVDTITLGVSS